MRYVLRIISLPFFIGLLLIGLIWTIVLKSYLWIRYGGEAINYNDKMNRKTVAEVFYSIQNNKP
jgi:hypothetical protein